MSLAPVFLSCAVTGGMSVPGQSEAIPITPEEIVELAVEASEAGAAIMHIHVREPDTGKPIADLGLFKEVLAGIGERCDAIAQPTSGGGVGMTIEERRVSVAEVEEEFKSGALTEAFGAGTAAVVATIGVINIHGTDYAVKTAGPDSFQNKVKERLNAIRMGTAPDVFNWNYIL